MAILVGIILWIALGVMGWNAWFLLEPDTEQQMSESIIKRIRGMKRVKEEDYKDVYTFCYWVLTVGMPVIYGPILIYWLLKDAVKRVFK